MVLAIDLHLIPIDSDSIAYDGFHLHVPLRYDGGVAMYIANNIAFVERDNLSTPGLEIKWCEIHIYHRKFLLEYYICSLIFLFKS